MDRQILSRFTQTHAHQNRFIAYNVQMSEPNEEIQEPLNPKGSDEAPVDPAFTLNLDLRRLFISAFILWQMFAVAVWNFPPGAVNFYLMPIVASYMRVTGCWQGWTMFSPNPSRDDDFVQAQITYADGVHRDWNIERMHDMGLVERYQKERFRKMIENANPKDAKRIWPFLARYAMIRNDRGPGTYPAKVSLVRYWRYIVPPNQGWRTLPFVPQPMMTQTFTAPVLKDNPNK
jgi:hypothetical protein